MELWQLLGAFVLLAGTCALLLSALSLHRWAIPWFLGWLKGYLDDRLTGLRGTVSEHERQLELLPRTWREMHDDAKRIKARAHYHVSRARKELAANKLEDPELDTLREQLLLIDGGGGGEGELPQVRDPVEESPPPAPDPLAAAFDQKWGRRSG